MAGLTASPPITRTGGDTLFMLLSETFSVTAPFFKSLSVSQCFFISRLVQTVIEPMAKDGLRTICLAYRDFVPTKAEKNQVNKEHKCKIIISEQFSGKIIFSGPLRLVNGAEL